MKVRKLKLKGFTGIRDGLGRDEITLDFEALTGDAALVALVGPNGMGKTTVMDNMHPYRLMPSRATANSPAAFSFYEHLCMPDALKELEWEHHGRVYRSTLVFKINGRKKTEAYFHVRDESNGNWETVRIADGTVSDGKTDTYDKCVDTLLGSPEMFFTSQFSAQNRAQLSSYNNGEIKQLMAELLGLEKIRETGAQAQQVARLLRSSLDGMRVGLEQMALKETELSQLQTTLALAQTDVPAKTAARDIAKAAVVLAQHRLGELLVMQTASAETEVRRQGLQNRITENTSKLTTLIATLKADIAREQSRVARLETEAKREAETAERLVKDIRGQIDKSKSLIERKDEIIAAKANVETLHKREQESQATIDGLKRRVQAIQDLNARKAALEAKLEGITKSGKVVAERKEGLERQSKLTEIVPCRGGNLQKGCPLLKDALDAMTKISVVSKERADLLNDYGKEKAALVQVVAEMAAIGDPTIVLAEAETSLRALAGEIRRTDLLAALEPSLVSAEESIAGMEAQISSIVAGSVEKLQSFKREIAEAQALVISVGERIEETEKTGLADLQSIHEELASLAAPFDASSLAQATQLKSHAEAEMAKKEELLDAARRRVAELQASAKAIEAMLESGAKTIQKAHQIEDDLAKWTTLAKAFGNDGIVALSIDDAGPTLSALVNDLLLSCYGARFTVSIKTQERLANGALKEGFDIIVFDGQSGSEKSVTLMSGGQRVWINECLTRAIALYLAQSSGQRYATLFSDEADGPLDPERKKMFMQMKRRVLELGGYEREYFISQTPELQSMADCIIDFEKL